MKTWTPRQIRTLRTACRWTQKELAAALGVTIDTIQNYEQGRRRPRARVLRSLDREAIKRTFAKVGIYVR